MTRPEYIECVRRFAESATGFCRVIERRRELSFDELILELDAALPALYLHARDMAVSAPHDLLQLEPSTGDENLDFDEFLHGGTTSADHEAEALAGELASLFDRQDVHFEGVDYTYSYVADDVEVPEGPATEVFRHSNSAELAAIYMSLRSGLTTFRGGRPQDVEDAGRDWLFGFYGEWGEFVPHLLAVTFRLAHATISDEEMSIDL